jgi:hypothetical protein
VYHEPRVPVLPVGSHIVPQELPFLPVACLWVPTEEAGTDETHWGAAR